jgi:hypothetical protein
MKCKARKIKKLTHFQISETISQLLNYRLGPLPRNPTELTGSGSFRLSIACNRLITWKKNSKKILNINKIIQTSEMKC